jgi:hypothetical protein
MTRPLNCPSCGKPPHVSFNVGYTVACTNCGEGDCSYDGTMHWTHILAAAMDRERAIQDWNAQVQEVLDERLDNGAFT